MRTIYIPIIRDKKSPKVEAYTSGVLTPELRMKEEGEVLANYLFRNVHFEYMNGFFETYKRLAPERFK